MLIQVICRKPRMNEIPCEMKGKARLHPPFPQSTGVKVD